MSNTRVSTDGSFHQERFCSAEAFSKGLLANIVAKRCELLGCAEDRELIWWLQHCSHRDGLAKIAADLLEQFPGRIAKASANPEVKWRNDLAKQAAIAEQLRRGYADNVPESILSEVRAAAAAPEVRPIADRELPELLARICADPSVALRPGPWYFSELAESLADLMRRRIKRMRDGLLITNVGAVIEDELDYALHSGCMVLIEGASGTGKSWAAKAWCEAHPGRARYIAVPSSTDSIAFFRAIAEAIGCASGLSMKDRQLRERVQASLQSSKLMLCLDQAQYCWPHFSRNETRPVRINWLVTELVNHGVPIAFLSTPQFATNQKLLEEKTGWTSEEFIGRIGHYKKLSPLSTEDLKDVARFWLPGGDRSSIEALALYAQTSQKRVAAIAPAVKRAQYLADKDGKPVGFRHVREVIAENVFAPGVPVASRKSGPARSENELQSDRGDQQALVVNRVSQPIEQEI